MRDPLQPPRRSPRRWFVERVGWPLLDIRDSLLRPARPQQSAAKVNFRTRFRWAMLDFWDPIANRLDRVRRHVRLHPAVGLVAIVPVAIVAGILYAALIHDAGGSGPDHSAVVAAQPDGSTDQIAVRGAIADSSGDRAARERRARRARRAERHRRAVHRRNVARRHSAAKRHRAAARKRATRRARARRARRHRSAPSAPAQATPVTTAPPATPAAPPRSSTPSSPAPSAPSRPPRQPQQPQPSPGVQFDDSG
jgi:hypothetical protein